MELNETTAQRVMREVAQKAKRIVDGDHDYNTPAEIADALDKLNTKSQEASQVITNANEARRLSALGGAADSGTKTVKSATPTDVGRFIARSEAYKAAKGMIGAAAPFHQALEFKALDTDEDQWEGDLGTSAPYTTDILNGNSGALITPNYLPGIVDIRQQPLLVADLFAQGVTTSPVIVYMQELTRTYGIDATPVGNLNVAEGGTKPQSTSTFGRVNEPVVKIAHFVRISDEMMEDSAQLVSFLNASLAQGVRLREQQQLLNGSGTLPELQGVLNRTGLQPTLPVSGGAAGVPFVDAQAEAVMDAIHTQISNIRWNAFVEPDTILINPADWNVLRLAKDGNGQYFSGGPFTAAYGNNPYTNVQSLWGFRVVVSPAIAAGTVLIGGFRESGQIFRRNGIRIEMTNSDGTDFQENMVKVRAEERLGLAIFRPGGFGTITNAA